MSVATSPRRLLMPCLLAAAIPAGAQEIERGHALGIHSEVKYGPGFRHFDYVNPEAPKGG